jgi:hypothetical protein
MKKSDIVSPLFKNGMWVGRRPVLHFRTRSIFSRKDLQVRASRDARCNRALKEARFDDHRQKIRSPLDRRSPLMSVPLVTRLMLLSVVVTLQERTQATDQDLSAPFLPKFCQRREDWREGLRCARLTGK